MKIEELKKTIEKLQKVIDDLDSLHEKQDLSAQYFLRNYSEYKESNFTHYAASKFAEDYYEWRKSIEKICSLKDSFGYKTFLYYDLK